MTDFFEKKLEDFALNKQKHSATTKLRIIENHPKIPQITKETARFLKLKSLLYILKEDHKKVIQRYVLKRPFFYIKNFLKSVLKKHAYIQNNDAFLYGISSQEELEQRLLNKNALLVIGFSYCHKPLECPSGRFNAKCLNEKNNPVCAQCLIHKYKSITPSSSSLVFIIPTIHYIGEKMLKIKNRYRNKDVLFLITACEMSLRMFGDFGNMADIKGIGIRLGGRICNTMRAFVLSEKGIKPGLTNVSDQGDELFLKCLKIWNQVQSS